MPDPIPADPSTWPWAQRTPFAGWLHSQHLRDDDLGHLAAALRGDPDNPNPANGRELAAYLTSVGASALTLQAGALAWSLYLADVTHRDLAAGVAEYAELWAADAPGSGVTLAAVDLLAEISYGTAELPSAAELPALLCDLAPWLATFADTAVRAEGDRITLAYAPGLAMTCVARYGGSEESA